MTKKTEYVLRVRWEHNGVIDQIHPTLKAARVAEKSLPSYIGPLWYEILRKTSTFVTLESKKFKREKP